MNEIQEVTSHGPRRVPGLSDMLTGLTIVGRSAPKGISKEDRWMRCSAPRQVNRGDSGGNTKRSVWCCRHSSPAIARVATAAANALQPLDRLGNLGAPSPDDIDVERHRANASRAARCTSGAWSWYWRTVRSMSVASMSSSRTTSARPRST